MSLKTSPTPEPLSPQYVRDRQWLDNHIRELTDKHPDQWIAVLNEEVVAIGKDRNEVQRVMEQRYPNSEPVVWLLEATVRVYSDRAHLS